MKKTFAFGLAVVALMLGACGGDEEEKTSSSSDQLSMACLQAIPPGTPNLQAEFERCLNAPDDFFGPGGFPGPGGPGPGQPGPGGFPGPGGPGPGQPGPGGFPGGGCSVSVSCVNGSCTCGSGPRQGTQCDGSQLSGANSCNVICRSGC